MAITVEITAVRVLSVSAGVEVPVAMPLFSENDVYVYYGSASLLAELGTDYTVELDEDEFNTFAVTPTSALITKINALIVADPTEINYITIRRVLDYTTEATAAGVRYTPFTAREFDRIAMRFQQLDEKLKRALTLSPNFVGDESLLELNSVEADRVLAFNSDGTKIVPGPTATEVANAQGYAETAIEAKDTAVSAATTATNAASTATTAAGVATTKAGEASTSATAAAGSATTASDAATTATTKAGEASTSAATATTKAGEASTSATAAAGSATAASGSATAASGSATAAGTSATNAANSATAASGSAAAAAASAASVGFTLSDLPWIGKAIGEVIYLPTDLAGIVEPPTNNPLFRFIKLTAGLTGSGQYNNGVLTSESTTGSAPLVVSTGVISASGSPINGRTIPLLNTEGRFVRPGTSAGTKRNDQMQVITGRFAASNTTWAAATGAFSGVSSFAADRASGGQSGADINFTSANSSGARTGSDTYPKHIEMTAYMRIW